nr:MAG TPA: hypothetical protein [Caudoviricetes sp.]
MTPLPLFLLGRLPDLLGNSANGIFTRLLLRLSGWIIRVDALLSCPH